MKKLVTLLFSLIVLAGCSKKQELNYTVTEKDGIKTFNNKNVPSQPGLTYSLTKLFTIGGDSTMADTAAFFRQPADLDVDKSGNIYILDISTCSVKKFDNQGRFITSFGHKGSGPGEFVVSIDMGIVNDTLCVQETETGLVVRYDLNGRFIDKIPYPGAPGVYLGESIKSPGRNRMIGYEPIASKEGDDLMLGSCLLLMDSQFKQKSVLRKFLNKFDPENIRFFETLTKYAYGDSNIFVAENEDSHYKISIYDLNGKQTGVIKKSYATLEYNPEEMEIMNKKLNLSWNGKKIVQKKANKKAINALYYDKYGRLLACSSQARKKDNQDKFYADVFKDGVFFNRVEFKELVKQDYVAQMNDIETYFFNDKIYVLNLAANSVTVYDYQ